MVKGIEEAMSPLLIVSSVFGFRRLGYSLGISTLWFSLLYVSVLWIIYVFVAWRFLPIIIREVIWSGSAHLPNMYLDILMMFISTIIGLCTEKKFEECLKRIAMLDETLEDLGVSKDYSKQYKTTLGSVVVWFSLSCFTILSEACLATRNTWELILFLWFLLISDFGFYINTIVDLNFGVLLGCLSTRLDRVNELVLKLVDEKINKSGPFQGRSFLSSRQPVNDEKNKRLLWLAMHLHLEICKISRELNRLYQVQMTLEMISICMTLTAEFVYFYRTDAVFRQGIHYAIAYYLVNVEWVAISIAKLYYINSACDRASSKANSTKGIMDKAIYALRNTEDQQDMTQFILQIMQNPLKFTAMGLFDFGHDFIRQLLVFVATVVIIMLQMDVVPKIQTKNQLFMGNNGTSGREY